MLHRWSCFAAALAIAPALGGAAYAASVGFESFALPPYSLGPESFYNGSDGAGGFTESGAFFNNLYTDFGGGFYAWSGWSASNVTDNTTPGFPNQFSAYTGGGAGGSAFYGVAYCFAPGDAYIDLPAGAAPASIRISNATYAAISMRDGDSLAKKFGGPSGDDPDFFKLTIAGLDADGSAAGAVEFYLADYRFADNTLDYIVDDWVDVDLTPLTGAARLSFGLESSDNGVFGMNTPAYFVADDLTFVPEPASIAVVALGCALTARRRLRVR